MKINDSELGLWKSCKLWEGEVLRMEKEEGLARRIVIYGAGKRKVLR